MATTGQGNQTNHSGQTLEELNDAIAEELIPAMVFVGLLMVLGVVGNLFVCFIFSFRLRMGTQHFLIVWLAVFDLFSSFIAMPTEIVDMRFFLMFNSEFACRMLRFINSYCAFASILTLVVIAVDRFRKVCHPLKRQMSLRHVKMAVAAVLVVALLFAIPAPLLYGVRTTETVVPGIYGHDCSTNDKVKDTLFPLVYNSILFLAFLVLLVTLSVLYTRIWREMKRHRRYMARNSDAANFPVKGNLSLGSRLHHRTSYGPSADQSDHAALSADIQVNTGAAEEDPTRRTADRRDSTSQTAGLGNSRNSDSSQVTFCELNASDNVHPEHTLSDNAHPEHTLSDNAHPEHTLSDNAHPEHTLSDKTGILDKDQVNTSSETNGQPTSPGLHNDVFESDDANQLISGPSSNGPKYDVTIDDKDLTNVLDNEAKDYCEKMLDPAVQSGESLVRPAAATGDPTRHGATESHTEQLNGRLPESPDVDRVREAENLADYNTASTEGASHCSSEQGPDGHPATTATTNGSCCREREDGHDNRTHRLVSWRSSTPEHISHNTSVGNSALVDSTTHDDDDKHHVTTSSTGASVRTTRAIRKMSSVSEVRNTKATIIAFSVTVVFFLSFVPHLSLITSRIVVKDYDRTLHGAALVFYNIFLRSYFVNSVSNPIIYGVLNTRFRAESWRLLRELLTCRKHPAPAVTSDT